MMIGKYYCTNLDRKSLQLKRFEEQGGRQECEQQESGRAQVGVTQ